MGYLPQDDNPARVGPDQAITPGPVQAITLTKPAFEARTFGKLNAARPAETRNPHDADRGASARRTRSVGAEDPAWATPTDIPRRFWDPVVAPC